MEPLPFQYQFLSGAVAGVTELLCLYPLDVVKTRMQLQGGGSTTAYTGMLDCFRKIAAQEGYTRFYRGLLPPLMLEAPKRAVKFSANAFWGDALRQYTGRKNLDQVATIMTGCAAGATESVVVVPFELVKIRLQDKASVYTGPSDVIRRVIAAEGVLGLYNGLESTFWRHVVWNGGYFGSIFQVKKVLDRTQLITSNLGSNFLAGTIGGLIGTLLNTPFDVVKSRIQNTPKQAGVQSKYRWTFSALVLIAKEEGASALYKGFLPKVLRLAPGGGILLLVVDSMNSMFRSFLTKA